MTLRPTTQKIVLVSALGLVVFMLVRFRQRKVGGEDLKDAGDIDLESNRGSRMERDTSSWRSRGSKGSARSIGSIGSFCSIGSIGSSFSIGSIGSFCSIGSIGSAFSIGSIGAVASVASVLSERSFAGLAESPRSRR